MRESVRFVKGYLVALILLVVTPAYAGEYLLKGAGAHPCSHFLDTSSDPVLRSQWKQWLNGFISGANLANSLSKGDGIDESAFVYEVKNYCEKNPMKDVGDAAEWLYKIRLK